MRHERERERERESYRSDSANLAKPIGNLERGRLKRNQRTYSTNHTAISFNIRRWPPYPDPAICGTLASLRDFRRARAAGRRLVSGV